MPRLQGDPAATAQLGGTVERFISTPSDPPHADTPELEEALRLAFADLQARHAPRFVAGTELLRRLEGNTRLLPLGCDSIDTLLLGGVREGQVLEVFGDTASGKTQLCMLAAATTAARGERVAYVDTSNAFSPHRAAEMMRGAPGRVRPVEELLDLITVVRAYTAHSALAALDALLLQAGAGGAPRLVILDSIGAVVSPVLGGGAAHSQGHALLVAIAGALKELGERLGAGVVVTNHLVGGGGGDGGGGGRQERRAALGESWAGQAHVRVQLAASPCEGAPCTATLRASTSAAPGAAVRYWLTAAGPAGRPEGEAAQQPGRAPPG